jgi:hypothetical protein
MSSVDELTPEELRRTLEVFLRGVLEPELRKLEDESAQRVNATIEALCGNTVGLSRQILSAANHLGYAAALRVRVRIGKGYRKGRYRFKCQSISTGLADNTGFSGFLMSGCIEESSSSNTALDSLSYRYNVWNWDPAFQV